MTRKLRTYLSIYLLLFTFYFGLAQEYEERLAALEDRAYEHFYTNKDSTYFYFNEINKLALANNQIATAIDNLNYVCFSAGYFYDLEKIKSTIEITDELVKKHSKVLDTLPDGGEFQKNYLNFSKGFYYHKLEDFTEANSYFDAIAKQIVLKPNYQDNMDNLELLQQCYNFIAQMSATEKKYEIANDYYEKNIRLFKQYIPNDLEGLYKVYNLYANSLYQEGNYQKAKNLWSISLDFSEKNYTSRNRNSIVTTTLLLSKVYKDLNNIDSANYYLDKIMKYKIKDEPFEDRYLIAKGEIHLKETNYTKALETFKGALNVSRENNKPRLRKKIGDLYLEIADSENALHSYQKGIIELSSGFNSTVLATNPNPASIKQKNTLLSLLAAKANALSKLQDSASKTSALSSVNTGLETLDLLKPSFKSQIDKLSLIEDMFTLFETGIETGHNLYEMSQKEEYIDTVFEYFEKSKSSILLDALLNSKATEFSRIPNNLIEKEKQLKTQISHFEKELFESGTDSDEKSDAIFALKQEHKGLVEVFESEYPSYYKLRYDTKVKSLAAVQEKLLDGEVFISFFYGYDAIYAILATNKNKKINKIPTSPNLEKTIREVHQMLGNSKSNLADLNKKSFLLYNELIRPIVGEIKAKKLIIVPDGLLNYVPFGSLNTQANGKRYLIQDMSISYANSATLWSQLKERKIENSYVLAFAPSFDSNISSDDVRSNILGGLPHNKTEVKKIMTSFNGKSLIDDNASLDNFISSTSDHSVFHFATHAVFDDVNPEYSYLAFSPSETATDLLFVKDLYNLQINAGMVTLSACESGIGELKLGEGFLSLARGFFYSGASSITSTLWKVNDASTATLMDSFYKNLSDGDSKDVALQKSQISFLESNRENGLSHPYHWSGFIISGNAEPLIAPNYWVWIGLGILLSAVAGFLVFGKKKES